MHVLRRTLFGAVLALAAASLTTDAAGQSDLINQARRLDLEGKQDAAIALYEQALDAAPDSFDAHYGIARALDLKDRYEEARSHFAKAIELSPEGTKDQTLRMMGISYAFTGSAREAAKYFQQVFDRRLTASNFAGASEVANELGRVYLEAGDLDNAGKWYRAGRDADRRQPGRPAWQVDLTELRWAHAQGRIAARRGNAQEARRQETTVRALLDKGTNRDQENQYPYLVGYVDFYLKDYRGAAAELQKADQGDPFILVLLGEANDKLGKTADASALYRKALASTSHAVNNAFARRTARQKLASPR